MGPVWAPAVCAGPAVVRRASKPPFRPWSRTPRCRRSVPLSRIMRARPAAARVRPRARRRGRALRPTPPPVGVGGRSWSFVPPVSGPGAGRGVPVSRELRAGLRAGGRAYRGGAVRARDCPRARGLGRGRTPPACSRRGFCGPQPLLSAEKPNGGPGSRPSLMPILHHSSESQVISRTKIEDIGQISYIPLN